VATHLIESLRGAGVPDGTIDEIISVVAPLAGDIVSGSAVAG
jgi:hemoglobin